MKAIQGSDFDMIIADIFMPDKDGFEFLEEIRARPDTATIPFIFLTGDRTAKSKVKGLELGVDGYVTKPCVIDELYAHMASILRRADAAAARAAPSGVTDGGWDFSGKLSALPPQELLQYLEDTHKSGLLRVDTQFGQGEMYFEKGDAVHATFAGIDGKEAVYLLFALEDGTFDYRSGTEAPMKTITGKTKGFLLEGLRRMDETRAILAMRDEALKRAAQK